MRRPTERISDCQLENLEKRCDPSFLLTVVVLILVISGRTSASSAGFMSLKVSFSGGLGESTRNLGPKSHGLFARHAAEMDLVAISAGFWSERI